MIGRRRIAAATTALLSVVVAIALVASPGAATPRRGAAASAEAAARPGRPRTPVVLFPAFHLTRLEVIVRNQTVAPGCPRSGSFEDWYENPHPSTTFSQVCRDELMTLRYDANPAIPMARRFSNPRGVTVRIVDYGQMASAPFYRPLYRALERVGYTANRSIRVAGYDARLTPDQGGFLHRAISLIERTYRQNGDRPVELVGHSNGPLYAQYVLTHTSRAWRHKYIHGFTPIAGNFPGQGSLYSIIFTGLNVEHFSYPTTKANALSSARMYLTSPATYMSAADPAVFGRREVVLKDSATGTAYTPADYRRLFADAGLPEARQIADHYIGFVKFRDRRDFPDVDVTAEKGSGIPTIVGAVLPSLTVGQLVKPAALLKRDGDINQEDITNNAARVWRAMPCYRFTLTDNPGVNHFALPSNPHVLHRLIAVLRRPRSRCG
ncbi:MAG: lipase/acyltransferase domain-containing protein [Solirubrobacteraceae bacterium]